VTEPRRPSTADSTAERRDTQEGVSVDADRRRSARRGLATAVVVCAAGAGLALFAATRTWSTSIEPQPAPLPARTVDHTGASMIGWLPALALVALAGAGALVATRGVARTAIGVLVLLAGFGVLGGAIDGLATDAGAWPVLVLIGGAAVVWAGVAAIQSGATWPAMGARYERPGGAGRSGETGAPRQGGRSRAAARGTHASMWDDLDRGVDPTDRER
jgi:tryptophan-associated transmembrane protein